MSFYFLKKHIHTLILLSALFSSYLWILTTGLGEFLTVNGSALENSQFTVEYRALERMKTLFIFLMGQIIKCI